MDVDTLKQRIIDAGEKPLLLFYGSPACGPTLQMFAVLDEFEETVGDTVEVITIEVEKSPDATKLCGVRATPTFIAFRNGTPLGNIAGTMSSEQLIGWFGQMLQPPKKKGAAKKKKNKKEDTNG